MVDREPVIYFFCDFGLPYVAEMRSRIVRQNRNVRVENLLLDAPAHDPRLSSKLLHGLTWNFPENSIFVCVVDPGVGGARRPLVVQCGAHWFVGPDNGIFEYPMRAARDGARAWEIFWRPQALSATFHGRDLFAPIAGHLALSLTDTGEDLHAQPGDSWGELSPWGCGDGQVGGSVRRLDWPDDLFEIVYFDTFGNAFTGIRPEAVEVRRGPEGETGGGIRVKGIDISLHRTFSDVPAGELLAYENAYGMVEIAVNGGSAREKLGLCLGDRVQRISRAGGIVR